MSRKREAIQIALELLKPTPSATQLNDARNVLAGALVGAPAGESLRSQCDRLARFIIENCAGYPQGDEGAMDAAVRIIRAQKNEIVEQRKRISEAATKGPLSKDWTSNSSDVAKLGRDMLGEGFTPNQNETVTVAAIRFIRDLKLELTEAKTAFETETATVRQVLGEELSLLSKKLEDTKTSLMSVTVQRDDLWTLLDNIDTLDGSSKSDCAWFRKHACIELKKRFIASRTPADRRCSSTFECSFDGGKQTARCIFPSGHIGPDHKDDSVEGRLVMWSDVPVAAAEQQPFSWARVGPYTRKDFAGTTVLSSEASARNATIESGPVVQPPPVTAIQCEATTEILYSGVGTASTHCLKPSGHKDAHRSREGTEWNDAATTAQPPPVSAAQEHAAVKRCINCNLTQDEHGKGPSQCARFTEYPKPCPYAHPLWRWVIIVRNGEKKEYVFTAPTAEDALAMFRAEWPVLSLHPSISVMRCEGRVQ